MSHNSKYYCKRLSHGPKVKCMRLDDFGFKKPKMIEGTDPGHADDAPVNVSLPAAPLHSSPPQKKHPSPPQPEPQVNSLPQTPEPTSETATSSSVDYTEGQQPTEPEFRAEPIWEKKNQTPVHFTLTQKELTLDAKYETAYKWLYFSCSKNGYMCKMCEVFGPGGLSVGTVSDAVPSPFLTGTVLGDHPIRKLEKHQASIAHQAAAKKLISKKTPSIFEYLQAKSTDTNVVGRNRKYIGRLIQTINFAVQNSYSLNSVAGIFSFMGESGCADITKFQSLNKSHYTSSFSVMEILTAMADHFEQKLLQKIRASPLIAVLADESTDEANRNQLAVLIRFYDNKDVSDHFIGLVNVKRADAETLTTAITSFLQSKDIDLTKVMFLGFDGCNTMSGQLNGVQRRFRNYVPHSLYINCRSHRLALCVKHLMNDFKVLEDVDEVLLSIYKLFHYSPQKFSVLKDVQASYAVKELVMVRAAATRWLSHGVACVRFIDRFTQIIDTLDTLIERKREPEIIGLRQMVTNKTTVVAILVLSDLLQPVNVFCKYLQEGSLDFNTVAGKLKELTDILHVLVDRFRASVQGAQEGLYVSKMAMLFDEIDERTQLARRLRERDHVANYIEELAVPMALKLIGELEDGFNLSPVLKAFSALSLRNLPETVVDLGNYGKEAMQTLYSHYGSVQEDTYRGHRSQAQPILDKVSATAEFEGFKHIMFVARNRNPDADLLVMMEEDDNLKATYPSMYSLLYMARLIPTSTASVERVFSLMNATCTNNRNRLNQETLSSLMLLRREGRHPLTEAAVSAIVDKYKENRLRDIPL